MLTDAPASPWCAQEGQPVIAQNSAARASFKALMNGYLREIAKEMPAPGDLGVPVHLECDLPRSFTRLRVEVTYWSLTGPHDFGTLHLLNPATKRWREAAVGEVIPLIVTECFARHGTLGSPQMMELLRRIFNSCDQIQQSSRHAQASEIAFLPAEQDLHFGHWMHPTPKSREGMTSWHQRAYAPEYGGSFQLHYFAAHNEIVETGVAQDQTLPEMLRQIKGAPLRALRPDEVLIPMHPLQAEALRLRPATLRLLAKGLLRDLGAAGAEFSATSSVRTVYSSDCPWMLKFSLPVKITNSERINLRHELSAGVVIARLLDQLAPLPPKFRVIGDPGYVTLALPDQRETGFEVILRDNPFQGNAGDGVVNIAALTADPLPGQSSMLARIIMRLSRAENALPSKIAKRWFSAYLDCALLPMLTLYDQHGIAFEAHQQNSLLDVSGGLPSCYFFRDNQGYYIADTHLSRQAALEPELTKTEAICFPQHEINQRFCYYLLVNQIFSVISRLGRDGFADEAALIEMLRKALRDFAAQASGPALGFVEFVLSAPKLSCKGNLLTRVHDVDELQAEGEKAKYIWFTNPLATASEIRHAV